MIHVTIKRAADGRYIVEEEGQLPIIFNSLAEMVINLCQDDIANGFNNGSTQFDVAISIEVNQIKTKPF